MLYLPHQPEKAKEFFQKALAGVCQSVLLISQLAQKGEVDNQDAFQTTIHSLLITQPEDTLAVFGGDVQHLKVGLNTLIEQLTQLNDKNLLNYWGSLLALESKLNKQPEIKQELGRRIARLPEQLSYHDNQFDDEMFSIMANIYVDTISPLGKRIYSNKACKTKFVRVYLLAFVLPFCGVKSAAANGNCYFIVKN